MHGEAVSSLTSAEILVPIESEARKFPRMQSAKTARSSLEVRTTTSALARNPRRIA